MKLRTVKYSADKLQVSAKQGWNLLKTAISIFCWKLRLGRYTAPSPVILMVEPTNRCNFRCPLCGRGAGKLTRAEGDLSLERFRQIIDDAQGLKMLFLWNQGEPLLNRKLDEFIKYAKSKSIFCVVSTNGSLLERDGKKLLDAGLDELIVSLDGASAETFSRYRQGGDFDKIILSIKDLVNSRGNKLKPLISLQFLLLKHNTGEIGEFKRLAKQIGADRVLWKTAQVSNSDEAMEYLPQTEGLSRYRDYEKMVLRRIRKNCRRIFYSSVIDWNGNMTVCCFDKDEDFVMGNVFLEGLEKVWRGEKFRSFRVDITQGKMKPMCYNCTEGLEKLFISSKYL